MHSASINRRLPETLRALYKNIVKLPLEPIMYPSAKQRQWLGLLMIIGHLGYGWLWSQWLVQPYENPAIRTAASLLGLVLVHPKVNRESTSHIVNIALVIICWIQLPVFFSWMYLCNGGNTVWLASTSIMILLWYQITNWRLATVGLLWGAVIAWLLYVWTWPEVPQLGNEQLATHVAVIGFSWVMALFLGVLSANARQSQLALVTTLERNKALEMLAGSIAHEMRNPLGQIQYGFASIAQTLPVPTTNHPVVMVTVQNVDQLYQQVAAGERAVKRGLQVIAMILDEVKSQAIDTSHFVHLPAGQASLKAVNEYGYESRDEAGKVRVAIVRDFMFKGNETIYFFVLFNLIKNALYYFKQHPDATLTIAIDAPSITVTDTGPGIAADRLAHLFEPFQSAGKSGGTGLGLSYCKRAMCAFGGDITCESVLGKYTRFILHFSEVTQMELDAHEEAVLRQARTRLEGKRILVVDDDVLQRAAIIHMLRDMGARIEEAKDGGDALGKFVQATYDLVVLDINMPVLDGYAVAQRIRNGEVGNRAVPIVACSGEPTCSTQAKLRRIGIDELVCKPCRQVELVQALERALDRVVAASSDVATTLAGRTVLLADDSDYNRAVIGNMLRKWGMQVIEATHGQAAVDLLKENCAIDLVLMDIQMPDLNGMQATRAIRSKSAYHRQIPILAMTGYSDDAHTQAAYEAGMNDVLVKPVEWAVLQAKLAHHIFACHSRVEGAPQSRRPDMSEVSARQRIDTPNVESAAEMPLLNLRFLDQYRLAGVLDSDMMDFRERADQLLEEIDASVAGKNLPDLHQALHALLGLYGLAGYLALREFMKRLERQVTEGLWPVEDNWPQRIRELDVQTMQALRNYYAEHGLGVESCGCLTESR